MPAISDSCPAPLGSVLVVDLNMPRPDRDSGSVRLTAIMHMLVRMGHQVTFIAWNAEFAEPYGSELQRAGIEVRCQPEVWGIAHELALRGKRYDLILMSRYYVAQRYLAAVRRFAPQAVLVFDTVDVHHLRMLREAKLANRPELFAAQAVAMAQELGVVRGADATVVVSDAEKTLLLKEMPEATVYTVSNIHEVRERTADFDDRRDIFFVGGFAAPANLDAMLWYIRDVWSLLREKLPGVVTHVIGSNVPESLKKLAGDGINLVGFARDLTPYLEGCRVSLRHCVLAPA